MDIIKNSYRIGRCIYCLSEATTDDPLSDEHILPYGIYGTIQLIKGTCRECAKKTSAFESKVMKSDLGGIRNALNFPSRHKNVRASGLPVEVVKEDGQTAEVLIPRSDYPCVLVLPEFPLPAYVDKRQYERGIEMIAYRGAQGRQSLEKLTDQHRARELAIYTLRWEKAWAQMLAKIAYACTVRVFGLDNIREAYVLGAILDTTDDVGMWVGCDDREYLRTNGEQAIGYSLEGENGEVWVRIRLFSFIDTPEYLVVVGRIKDPSNRLPL
jgi:hypothetical protein